MEKEITLEQLKKKLKALGEITDEQRNEIICSIVGHSRIKDTFFGYFNCARCGQQLGDILGSIYPYASQTVIVGHKCKTCKENFKKCDWKDKLFVKDPFAKDENKAKYLLKF